MCQPAQVIFDSLAATLAAKARLTVLVAAAVLVGAAGGVHAATAGPSLPVTVSAVADTSHADKVHKDKARTTEPKAQDQAAKPAKSPRPAGVVGQTHGACVSAVARDINLVGGRNNNHGGAVSAAAHSCAGSQGKKSDKATKPAKPAKPAKPTKPTKPTKSAHPSDDPQDPATPES
jgi:hypothetical protein